MKPLALVLLLLVGCSSPDTEPAPSEKPASKAADADATDAEPESDDVALRVSRVLLFELRGLT
jgi:PBP1b-binding outer membrane lipoprotein LpoB